MSMFVKLMRLMAFDLFMVWSICVLVAVAIQEEFCMAFADMQLLFLSDERIVAHGLLVFSLLTSCILDVLYVLAAIIELVCNVCMLQIVLVR